MYQVFAVDYYGASGDTFAVNRHPFYVDGAVPDFAWRSVGYSGEQIEYYGSGEDQGSRVSNTLSEFIASRGLQLGFEKLDKHTTRWSILNSTGSPMGRSWETTDDPRGDLKAIIAVSGSFIGGSIVGAASGGYTGVAASTAQGGAMNAALAESAVGTIGYGASSVGAGANAYGAGMSFFDGYNFSSGESSVFTGDAQLTNYGTGYANTPDVATPNGWEYGPSDSTVTPWEVNGTPDVTTNDFGTRFDTDFADVTKDFVTPEPIQIAPPAESSYLPQQTGNVAGTLKSWAGQTNDVLGTFANVIKNVGVVAGVAKGVQSQVEVKPRTTNQLRPTGGAPAGGVLGMTNTTVLLIGAALLAGVFLYKKG